MAPTVLCSVLTKPSLHTPWETRGSSDCACQYALPLTPLPYKVPIWDSPILHVEAPLSTFCLRCTVVTTYTFSYNKKYILHLEHNMVPTCEGSCQPVCTCIWVQNRWSWVSSIRVTQQWQSSHPSSKCISMILVPLPAGSFSLYFQNQLPKRERCNLNDL